MNVFDIIGPIMIGPSSSHTAGAVRIGNLARSLFGRTPNRATINLYNSFSKTGTGHGTDKAIVAGLLGYAPDDPRIVMAFSNAEDVGFEFKLNFKGDRSVYHPNTAEIELFSGNESIKIIGNSIGGGRVIITNIDDYDIKFSGEYNSLMIIHKDVPGVVASVTAYLAKAGMNIDFLSLFRGSKSNTKLMIIETKQQVPANIIELLSSYSFIERAAVISKV